MAVLFWIFFSDGRMDLRLFPLAEFGDLGERPRDGKTGALTFVFAGRVDRIRTCDPLTPSSILYRAQR